MYLIRCSIVLLSRGTWRHILTITEANVVSDSRECKVSDGHSWRCTQRKTPLIPKLSLLAVLMSMTSRASLCVVSHPVNMLINKLVVVLLVSWLEQHIIRLVVLSHWIATVSTEIPLVMCLVGNMHCTCTAKLSILHISARHIELSIALLEHPELTTF